MNSSYQNASQNKTFSNEFPTDYRAIAILSTLAVAIVAVNSLVFYLFIKTKSLRTSTNYPLFSLSVCDFFTGLVVIPLFIISSFVYVIESPSTQFYVGFVLVILHNFVAISTVYHILVVTAERYMAIKMPLRHRLVDKKSVYKVLIMVWFTAAIMSCIPFTWIDTFYPKTQPISLEYTFGYAIFLLVVVVVLPYIFMISAFVVMFKAISRGSTKGRNPKKVLQRSQSIEKQRAGERKCLILFATMATVFAVCWFPSFVMFLLFSMPEVRAHQWSALKVFSQVSLIIRYMTSVIDPLLYTFLKRDFYHAFEFVFTGIKRRRSSTSTTTYSRKGTLQIEFDQLAAIAAIQARRQSLIQRGKKEEEENRNQEDNQTQQQGEECKLCQESPL